MKLYLVILITINTLLDAIWAKVVIAMAGHDETPTTDFSEIINTTTFLDKTMMIYDLFHQDIVLLAAPRGFGKTTNLDMVKRFFEIQVDEEGEPKDVKTTFNYDLFVRNNLTIISKKKRFKRHFGKYPVLYLDYSLLCNATDFTSMFFKMREIQKNVFSQHKYILKSPRLDDSEKELFSDYIRSDDLGYLDTHLGFYMLSAILFKHFNKSVCVLIDNFDTFLLSLPKDESIAAEMISFVRSTNGVFLWKNRNIIHGLLMSDIIERDMPIQPSNVRKDCLFYDHFFWQYFGITENEFEVLLPKVANGSESEKLRMIFDLNERNLRAQFTRGRLWKDAYGFLYQPRIFKMYSYHPLLRFLQNKT